MSERYLHERYARQIRFHGVGEGGQRAISAKHVLIIGAGALGCANAEMLTRAGIGKLTIVDRDFVDFSNLQRQQLFTTADARERLPKAEAAKRRLHAINPEVSIEAIVADADADLLATLLTAEAVALMVDGTDNFDTRFVMNDSAMKFHLPWLYGACVASSGIVYFIERGRTPCLHCLLGHPPASSLTCDTAGIISPTVQMTAALQVGEALKYLSGNKGALSNRLVAFDSWKNEYSAVSVDALKQAACPSCGEAASYPFLTGDEQANFTRLCGRDSVQVRPKGHSVALEALAQQLAHSVTFSHQNEHLLAFETENYQLTVFADGRTIIHGVASIDEGKKVYYRFFS